MAASNSPGAERLISDARPALIAGVPLQDRERCYADRQRAFRKRGPQLAQRFGRRHRSHDPFDHGAGEVLGATRFDD